MGEIIKNKNIFLFGAGRIGELIFDLCNNYMKILGFVDNDEKKQGTKLKEMMIYALPDVLEQNNIYLVITTVHSFASISEQLSHYHLKLGEDFCHYKQLFVHLYKTRDVLIQGYVELYITDKCSLRCANCALMIPYIPTCSAKDIEVDELKDSIRAYFNLVDIVVEFRILGGEPFLYRDLDTLIEFIGRTYSNQIQKVKLVSNGTIIPKASTLELIRKYDVEVDISDYPLQAVHTKQKSLVRHLSARKIDYKIMNSERWIDIFGNPRKSNGASIREIKELFASCNQGCRTLYERKLYFCSVDCAAQRNGIIGGDSGDYIDLDGDRAKMRNEIINFDFGVVPKGYVSFCKNCNGGVAINKCYIPVAEQLNS